MIFLFFINKNRTFITFCFICLFKLCLQTIEVPPPPPPPRGMEVATVRGSPIPPFAGDRRRRPRLTEARHSREICHRPWLTQARRSQEIDAGPRRPLLTPAQSALQFQLLDSASRAHSSACPSKAFCSVRASGAPQRVRAYRACYSAAPTKARASRAPPSAR